MNHLTVYLTVTGAAHNDEHSNDTTINADAHFMVTKSSTKEYTSNAVRRNTIYTTKYIFMKVQNCTYQKSRGEGLPPDGGRGGVASGSQPLTRAWRLRLRSKKTTFISKLRERQHQNN